MQDMRGIILAAGRGSRMGEMTGEIPKCLIPLQGRPLLDYQVAAMRMNGIREVLVIGGYRSEKFAGRDLTLLRNPDWETTNMVATLACARSYLDQDFILSYGDIVYRPDYVAALMAEPADIAVLVDKKWLDLWSLRFPNPYTDAETMRVDAKGFITELGKPIVDPSQVQGQYTGLLKFAGKGRETMLSLLEEMQDAGGAGPGSFAKMYMTSFLQKLIDGGCGVKAVMVENGWLELDSGSDYALYLELAAQGRLKPFFDPGVYHGSRPGW
jgi:L-glutamine-phosphate cytidylyltransferase